MNRKHSTKKSKSLHFLAGKYERDLVRLSPASRKAFLLSSGVFHSSFFSSSFFFSFSSSTITRLAASLLHKKTEHIKLWYGIALAWYSRNKCKFGKMGGIHQEYSYEPSSKKLVIVTVYCRWPILSYMLVSVSETQKQASFLPRSIWCLFAGLYGKLTNLSNQTYIDMHHLWVICTLIFLDLTWLTSWLCCSEVIWGSSSLSSSLAKPLRRFSSMGISQTSFSHQELIIWPEACRLAIPTAMQATGVVQTMAQKVICILLPYNPWSPCIPASWI